MTDDPILDLVRKAVDGDGDAFAEIYLAYQDAIYRYIFFRVSDDAEAEDLTEEVFLRAWEALPNFRVRKVPFKSWLYRIAHNLVIDRHRKRRPIVMPSEAIIDEPARRPLPEETVARMENHQALRQAILKLNAIEQEVILLRFVSGLSHQEVAKAIGKSPAASRVIQHRALTRLQKYLETHD